MTAPKGFVVRKWIIDLPTAQRFLKLFKEPKPGVKNTNRKWSPAMVNRYAVEMLAGRWGFCHQGFAFYGFLDDGTAEGEDGEQRCRALIQACTVGATDIDGTVYKAQPDFAFEVMVTEGLPHEAVRVMDIGKARNASDFMAMQGETNRAALGGTIALVYQYQNEPRDEVFIRDRWGRGRMTPTLRQDFLDANPGIRQAIVEGSRISKVMTVSAAAAGYFLALQAGMSKEVVDQFMDLVQSGVGMSASHPALRLRELLLGYKARAKRRNLPREDQLALFIKALNAYNKGHEILSLSFRTMKTSRGGAEFFPRFQP